MDDLTPATAAGIPYEDTDCTADEAVEAVKAVRTTAAPQGAFYVLEPGGRFRLHCSACGYIAPNTDGTITTAKTVCPWCWIGGHRG